MSYRTVEVELENDRVTPRDGEKLPAKGRGLLTILEASSVAPAAASLGELVRDLAGTGRGDFTDLSINKAHLADFGR
jgi:hypothetical protein